MLTATPEEIRCCNDYWNPSDIIWHYWVPMTSTCRAAWTTPALMWSRFVDVDDPGDLGHKPVIDEAEVAPGDAGDGIRRFDVVWVVQVVAVTGCCLPCVSTGAPFQQLLTMKPTVEVVGGCVGAGGQRLTDPGGAVTGCVVPVTADSGGEPAVLFGDQERVQPPWWAGIDGCRCAAVEDDTLASRREGVPSPVGVDPQGAQ